MGRVKDQIMSLFKTKDYIKQQRVKNMYMSGKKQSEENIIKSIRSLFKLKKENEVISDRIIRDIRRLFEQKEEKYYSKSIRAANPLNSNYIKNESSGGGNKSLSVKENLDEIYPTREIQ